MQVILKTLPTHEAVRALGAKIIDEVHKQQMDQTNLTGGFELEVTERGFNVHSASGSEVRAGVRVLITTIGRNFRLISSAMHLDMKYLQSHLAAVRHRYELYEKQ